MTRKLDKFIFASRWILYPINVGLIIALIAYVGAFLYNDYHFLTHKFTLEMEHLMMLLLSLVDASMVANLIVMIAQGSHQIFIRKFDEPKNENPQYLDHIDSGILKVKVALSIASITLVQILKDFVNIESVDWVFAQRRIIIHLVALLSALFIALIWRITNPHKEKHVHA